MAVHYAFLQVSAHPTERMRVSAYYFGSFRVYIMKDSRATFGFSRMSQISKPSYA